MAPSFAPVVTTSEVFESYQDDYRRLQRSVRDKLAIVLAKGDPSVRGAAMRDANEAHQRADQALQQMQLEAKSMGALSASIAPKLRDYQNELAAQKRRVREAQDTLQRDGLGFGARNEEDQVLNDSYNRLRFSTRRLDDTKRTALEAEEIGLDIMSDLQSQREDIMRTKGHLHDIDENLNLSKRVLQLLGYRMQTNQSMVVCFAVVLTVTVALVFYLKMQKFMAVLR